MLRPCSAGEETSQQSFTLMYVRNTYGQGSLCSTRRSSIHPSPLTASSYSRHNPHVLEEDSPEFQPVENEAASGPAGELR